RLAGGSVHLVWAEKPTANTQGVEAVPSLLEEINGRLWEITNRSMKAAQKPRPANPTFSPPAVRKKGEFEKTADYEAYVQNEKAKHTAAYNASLAAYQRELATYERELAEIENSAGAIYVQHAKQHLPAWLGAMDKSIRYDADKEHYVLSIASGQYPEYRITGILPVPIVEAKSKNEQIRNAPAKVVFSIANGSLEAKGIIVSTETKNYSGSAASTTSLILTERAAREREEQLAAAEQAAKEKRLRAEMARREEAERIARIEAEMKAEADKAARIEAQRIAVFEAKEAEQKRLAEEAERKRSAEEAESRRLAKIEAQKEHYPNISVFKRSGVGSALLSCVASNGNLDFQGLGHPSENLVQTVLNKSNSLVMMKFKLNPNLNQTKLVSATMDDDDNPSTMLLTLKLELICGQRVSEAILPDVYNNIRTLNAAQRFMR
ncbi:MAG: hypothetical protein KDB22_28910, partial [Planctomycetales bacterium]|nr:hypothetical protein [Planctomycetales bacterium]